MQTAGGASEARRRARGFTLIEVLIAITITALLGTGAFMLLNQAIRNRDVLEAKAALLEALQKTDRLLAGDLSGLVDRPVRDAYGMQVPALTTANTRHLLELTRTGWRDATTLLQEIAGDEVIAHRSALQRVAYRLEDEVLYRDYWGVLDQAQDSQPVTQTLLRGVLELRVRFLDAGNQWNDEWPVAAAAESGARPANLPKGIEVVLRQANYGEIRRVFPVAAAQIPASPGSRGAAGGGERAGGQQGEDQQGGDQR